MRVLLGEAYETPSNIGLNHGHGHRRCGSHHLRQLHHRLLLNHGLLHHGLLLDDRLLLLHNGHLLSDGHRLGLDLGDRSHSLLGLSDRCHNLLGLSDRSHNLLGLSELLHDRCWSSLHNCLNLSWHLHALSDSRGSLIDRLHNCLLNRLLKLLCLLH